jgi:hypothetical protein
VRTSQKVSARTEAEVTLSVSNDVSPKKSWSDRVATVVGCGVTLLSVEPTGTIALAALSFSGSDFFHARPDTEFLRTATRPREIR